MNKAILKPVCVLSGCVWLTSGTFSLCFQVSTQINNPSHATGRSAVWGFMSVGLSAAPEPCDGVIPQPCWGSWDPPGGNTAGLILSGPESPRWEEEREPHHSLCTPSSSEPPRPLSGSADASGSWWGGLDGSWVPVSASAWVWAPGTAQCGVSLRGRDRALLWGHTRKSPPQGQEAGSWGGAGVREGRERREHCGAGCRTSPWGATEGPAGSGQV